MSRAIAPSVALACGLAATSAAADCRGTKLGVALCTPSGFQVDDIANGYIHYVAEPEVLGNRQVVGFANVYHGGGGMDNCAKLIKRTRTQSAQADPAIDVVESEGSFKGLSYVSFLAQQAVLAEVEKNFTAPWKWTRSTMFLTPPKGCIDVIAVADASLTKAEFERFARAAWDIVTPKDDHDEL